MYTLIKDVHVRKKKKSYKDTWMSEREEYCDDGWMFLNKLPTMMCLTKRKKENKKEKEKRKERERQRQRQRLHLTSFFFPLFFYIIFFSPPNINGSNSKLSLLWLHNLEKKEKNYEDINTTVSFSVLRCFRSTGYLLLIMAHERMCLLFVSAKEGGTQNKTHVPSRVLYCPVYIFLVILFSFVILAISNCF